MNREEKRDYLKRQTHEQLEICILNNEMMEDILRDRLYLLSGCRNFGGQDGTDGSCIDCYITNRDLHQRCCLFQTSAHMYLTTKYETIRKNFKDTTEDIEEKKIF